jgi:hypothetical protein
MDDADLEGRRLFGALGSLWGTFDQERVPAQPEDSLLVP